MNPDLDARIEILIAAISDRPEAAKAFLADFWYEAQAEFSNQWRRVIDDTCG